MGTKKYLLIPFLVFPFFLSSCSDNKIEALGDEMLKYLDFNVGYIIKEDHWQSLYLTLEIVPKSGYEVEKITCTVSCSISYTYIEYDGTEISNNKRIDILNFSCSLKKEFIKSAPQITYADAYFESFFYGREGCACTLVKI